MNEPYFNNSAAGRGFDAEAAVLDGPAEEPTEAIAAAAPAGPPRRGRVRRNLPRVILALAALGGLAWYAGLIKLDTWRTSRPWRAEPGPRPLVLYGNVDVRQVELSFKVEGRIARLAVDEGDKVEPGQVLASLDRVYFEDEQRLARARRDAQAATLLRLEHGSRPEEIAMARAQTAEREAMLARAQADFARAQELIGGGGMSREDYDLRRTALQAAEAELQSARASQRLVEIGPRQEDIDVTRAQLAEQEAAVTQAERRCEDSTLKAPGQGVILTRARETGAIVKPGETVFTLTLTTPVWVRTYVPEPKLGTVRPGMAVEVVTDSTPSRLYAGYVGYISPTAEFTPKAVETPELRTQLVYRTRIVIDHADDGLRQGMPVTVRIKVDPGNPGHGH